MVAYPYRQQNKPIKTSVAFLLLVFCSFPDAQGKEHRSHASKSAFQRVTPCPSTGDRRGRCPSYVIDHIKPLCAGGADAPSNMQWQTVADAKAKDKLERQECRNR